MKKILICLFVLIGISLTLSAQIQRSFFGLRIDNSTKENVIQYLNSISKPYTIEDGSICIYDVNFGGLKWFGCNFEFYNNKLCGVSFSETRTNIPKSTLDDAWNILKSRLYSKYSKYFEAKVSSREKKVYHDGKTSLTIRYVLFKGAMALSLSYYDWNMAIEKMKTEEDEL